MVLPKRVARFNKVVTNRVLGPFAGSLPGFAILTHKGRKSGTAYRIPLNVFRTSEGYVVALTYGPGADWVKNVLAANGCEIRTRGKDITLTAPRLVHDEERSAMPPGIRHFLGLVGVTDFLFLTRKD
ncbi:nitroreductase [Prauserella marina]|uniref:Deazaflavin-dependent oxidoreductase, nitroreductase family n=1 Tax=Prauserella marina TaxID=530584 RepID=A0A222VNL9_9PSEU|nr:nitroreductase family deazaflavin-dependent oxidoreductase [Prauserella marina]ASR35510.1 nitroreductase [Prauserella marina]PWV84660.1 deazaflavin-dependent oxidoreductase (nitroreductase family) [Prauserella marina]SDC16429.1 deazaflavin-dependent oxidoreductase, nitroreductase family [Prauserella marina]